MHRAAVSVRVRVSVVSVLVSLVALALAAFGIRGAVADEAQDRAQDETRIWLEEFAANVRTDGAAAAAHAAQLRAEVQLRAGIDGAGHGARF